MAHPNRPTGRGARRRNTPRAPRILLAVLVAAATLLAPGAAIAAPAQHTPDQRGAPKLNADARLRAWAGYSVTDRARGPATMSLPAGVAGMDVSGHQGEVDWPAAWAAGARFTYVKATEGTSYTSPVFHQQYTGSHKVGMFRGAYHYALPNVSTGAAQARYFVANGGGWSPGSRTLPGALDIEYNPYGQMCYGLNPTQMSQWIADFSDTYRHLTGRFPAIYTTKNWWNTCTGGNTGFAAHNPLWVARYGPEVGALPAGWNYHTIWQYNDHGRFPGDQNAFNGGIDQLRRLAG